MMKLPDFVVNIGTDPHGKYHAFYLGPIEGGEMRGPARDTFEEAQADSYECLVSFARSATKNGLIVGDGEVSPMSTKDQIHVCRFSAGLDDLSRAQQANPAVVLVTLKRLGRYSCFEASDNRVIAKTMDSLHERRLLDSSGGAYPWSTCTVTKLGEQFLQDGILPPLPDPFEGMVRISKTVYVQKTIADKKGLQEYMPPITTKSE
jgi:hypothetical protein